MSLSLPGSEVNAQHSTHQLVVSLTGQPSGDASAKPPESIPFLCLESIHLILEFSSCRRCRISSKAQHQGIAPEDDLEGTQAGENYFTQVEMDQHSDSMWPSLGPQFTNSQGRGLGLPWTSILSRNQYEHPRASSSSRSIVISPIDSQDSISSSETLISTTDRPPSLCTRIFPQNYAVHEVKFEEVLKVLDASLHTMICGHMRGSVGGPVMSNDTGYPKLAEISPALFSPGYAEVSGTPKLVCFDREQELLNPSS